MTMAAIRILVVDDHTLFRRGLTALLQAQPQFTVVGEAGDAGEALRRAAELQPNVILLDNHLPGVNGVDALQGLREAAPQAKVLMLTVSEDGQTLATALQRGASGYLLKTVDSDVLAVAIRRSVAGQSTISPEMTDHLVNAYQAMKHPAAAVAAPSAGGRPRAQPLAARAPDPGGDRPWRQQQGNRAHAGDCRSHGEDPRAAHPAQAQSQFARAGSGVCGGAFSRLR
jgi:two-component system nitrate/nitrite response regulator NarL